MLATAPRPSSRLRPTLRLVGLCIGGLAPLITGLIGIVAYLEDGSFIARNGAVIEGPMALIGPILFILAGLGLIGLALRDFARTQSRDF